MTSLCVNGLNVGCLVVDNFLEAGRAERKTGDLVGQSEAHHSLTLSNYSQVLAGPTGKNEFHRLLYLSSFKFAK